jgi:hypothetical protein
LIEKGGDLMVKDKKKKPSKEKGMHYVERTEYVRLT